MWRLATCGTLSAHVVEAKRQNAMSVLEKTSTYTVGGVDTLDKQDETAEAVEVALSDFYKKLFTFSKPEREYLSSLLLQTIVSLMMFDVTVFLRALDTVISGLQLASVVFRLDRQLEPEEVFEMIDRVVKSLR